LARICREEIQPAIVPFIDRVAFDNGRRVVALDVEGKRRPYRTRDGRYYLRMGSEKREATREDLSALLDDARPVHYENVPALGSTFADIDESLLWSFVREFEGDAFDEASANGYPTRSVLERDLLLTAAVGGEAVPSVAGLLLFGRDDRVRELLARSIVVVTRFAGSTAQAPIIERVELGGNLLTLFDAILRFLGRYCDLWAERPRKLPQTEELESPVPARANYFQAAVLEAIANMLGHRDLALRDQPTRLHIFDRSLEFINPRRSAGFSPTAQKAIRYGVPQRLNPQLHALFTSPAYGLRLPVGGLPTLLRSARQFSNRRAEIVAFNDEFRLRMHGI
jgi:ATP-dependent DNA helicase RecG